MRNELCRMTATEYHADPCPPSLSSSIAHIMLRQSPAHARLHHPRLGGKPHQPSLHFDRGMLAHRLLLGAGNDIEIIEATDWRKRDVKALRSEARTANKIPVLRSQLAEAQHDADAICEEMARVGIVMRGESEVVALWASQAFSGAAVQCRGMIDHLDGAMIYDLKSCRSAHPEACQKHIDDYGYAIQHAAYIEAIETLRPSLAGRTKFVFVFFELEPPYAVTPIRLSGEFRELGKRRWKRAVETWERCLRTGAWPGYVTGITEIEPKPWVMAKDSEDATAAASVTWSKEGDPF